MQYQVDITLPDTPAAQAWWRQFQAWLEVAPDGVRANTRKGREPISDVVEIDELIAFFRPRLAAPRVHYNARMVLYYFVLHLNHLVVVRCTKCPQRLGACRCPDRGRGWDGEWHYSQFITPESDKGQHFWAIERASLRALDESQLPIDHSPVRRARVLEFLRHQKGE